MNDMKDADPGLWEPFQNHTHNGSYWAIRRHNSKWAGREEVMVTAAKQPRRFGTESAAKKAADAANKTA